MDEHIDFAGAFIDESCLCRVCGDLKTELVPIYECQESIEKNISGKINKHLHISVSEQDSLPLKICRDCFNLLCEFSQLYETCSMNDKKLRLLLVEKANSQISQIQSKTDLAGVDLELILEDELQFAENASIPLDEFNKSGSSIEIDIDKDLDRIFGKNVMENLVDGELQSVKTYDCEFCKDSGFHTMKELDDHIVEHHSDLVFCCDNCNHYINRNHLIEHMLEHVKEENQNQSPKIVEIQEIPINPNQVKEKLASLEKKLDNKTKENGIKKNNSGEKKPNSNSLQTCPNVKVMKKCYACEKGMILTLIFIFI
jgi:hypothetical protein